MTPGSGQRPPKIGVVIAFFQRQPGLLFQAISSAFAQGFENFEIIVVDDDSPVRAKDELAGLLEPQRGRVTIIEQPNAGPAAARNRGLDALSNDVEFVAFLDSDDQWQPGHIENALVSFAAGADIYFDDHTMHDSGLSCFVGCNLTAKDGVRLPEGRDLYIYSGDLFDAILRRSPIGTSALVYRRSVGDGLRFPEDYDFLEDIYFWLGLARRSTKVMFSTRCGYYLGPGVNISISAGWGTPQSLTRIFKSLKWTSLVMREYQLSPDQRERCSQGMKELGRNFAASLLHLIRHNQKVDWRSVAGMIRMQPSILLDATKALGGAVAGLFGHRTSLPRNAG